MLKFLSAAVLAAGLLAAPTLATAAQPAAQQTLITKEVADKAVPGKRYRISGKEASPKPGRRQVHACLLSR